MAEQGGLGGVQCLRCQAPATLQCPKCVQLGLAKAPYCSQDCFKQAWAAHKAVHKAAAASEAWLYCTRRGRGRSDVMPSFAWTGPLRPARIGPTRAVPPHIARPDYADDGNPTSELESRQQRSVAIRTPEEVAGIRAACRAGREALDAAHAAVRPGVTTDELDRVVHEALVEAGAYPSPLNYFNFPKSVCTSVNEVICHGIPDARELADGDLVNVDVTAFLGGYHGDLNETFTVGQVDEEGRRLIRVTHDALGAAIAACKPGVRYRDLGDVISRAVTAAGMSVVKTYCGHGIGDLFHCAPNIPHYAHNKAVGVMKEGQVFTIEPMVNLGTWRDVMWPDGWTAATADGKRSAQFEHQLLITATGAEVLTARLPTSPPLWPSRARGMHAAKRPAPGSGDSAAGSDQGAKKRRSAEPPPQQSGAAHSLDLALLAVQHCAALVPGLADAEQLGQVAKAAGALQAAARARLAALAPAQQRQQPAEHARAGGAGAPPAQQQTQEKLEQQAQAQQAQTQTAEQPIDQAPQQRREAQRSGGSMAQARPGASQPQAAAQPQRSEPLPPLAWVEDRRPLPYRVTPVAQQQRGDAAAALPAGGAPPAGQQQAQDSGEAKAQRKSERAERRQQRGAAAGERGGAGGDEGEARAEAPQQADAAAPPAARVRGEGPEYKNVATRIELAEVMTSLLGRRVRPPLPRELCPPKLWFRLPGDPPSPTASGGSAPGAAAAAAVAAAAVAAPPATAAPAAATTAASPAATTAATPVRAGAAAAGAARGSSRGREASAQRSSGRSSDSGSSESGSSSGSESDSSDGGGGDGSGSGSDTDSGGGGCKAGGSQGQGASCSPRSPATRGAAAAAAAAAAADPSALHECQVCRRLVAAGGMAQNKLTAACKVCLQAAVSGGTSRLARCPKRGCGALDVRLGAGGWHTGPSRGQAHYVSVDARVAVFKVHYTRPKRRARRKAAPGGAKGAKGGKGGKGG
ncbi:MAP1A [Scenedesmus sp. PABB004]|nr:MAP1A [Scenedesmus sp. PABB004]